MAEYLAQEKTIDTCDPPLLLLVLASQQVWIPISPETSCWSSELQVSLSVTWYVIYNFDELGTLLCGLNERMYVTNPLVLLDNQLEVSLVCWLMTCFEKSWKEKESWKEKAKWRLSKTTLVYISQEYLWREMSVCHHIKCCSGEHMRAKCEE